MHIEIPRTSKWRLFLWNIKYSILNRIPSDKNNSKKTLGKMLWAVYNNGRLKVFDSNGEPVIPNIKKGAWKLRPSINKYHLNELDITVYVNIADSEEEMLQRIEDLNHARQDHQ